MNAFNRVTMALVALVVLTLAVGVILIAVGAVASADLFGAGPFADAAGRLADGGARIVGAVVGGVVALLALVVLWLEILPPRRSGAPFVVVTTELGHLTVEREGVCRLVEKTARDLPEVTACRATVTSAEEAPDAVSARCLVTVTAGSTVKDVAAEVQHRVREVVESQVGLKMTEVDVRVRIGTAEPPPPQRTIE